MAKLHLPSNPGDVTMKYRPDIDGLRALAVASVVAYHAYPNLLQGGFIGVDIFFVISGYLISTILFTDLQKGRFNLIDFYYRRIRRIFPALLLVLLASFAFGWFYLMSPEFKELGKHITGGAGFVSNFILWGESGYFDQAAESKPLLHLWSLGIEEQFYIFWPLLLWVLWRWKVNLLLFFCILMLISFSLNILWVFEDSSAAFYSPASRFWELLVGASLAYMTMAASGRAGKRDENTLHKENIDNNRKHQPSVGFGSNGRSLSGTVLVVTGLFLITPESSFPGWYALLPVLGTALIISAGQSGWVNRRVLSLKFLVWIGLISYPLYLWHWVLLSYLQQTVYAESDIWRTSLVGLSFLLAWLTYIVLEKPVRYGKSRMKVKAQLLTFLMVFTGAGGYFIYASDGLGWRFPPLIQSIADYSYDFEAEYRQGTCFLRPEQSRRDFSKCETEMSPEKKNLLLWGDSHAAHLYPGYMAVYGNDFNIIQRTAASCPPIIGLPIVNHPHCKAINGSVSLLAEGQKPDVVVLAAVWQNYAWEKVALTVDILNSYGIADIYMVGPVPQWHDSLPKQLYRYLKTDIRKKIPERMTQGLNQTTVALDDQLSAFAENLGVYYLSPYAVLCNESGCLTSLDGGAGSLTAWDYGHLTTAGSRYVVEHFSEQFRR